MKQLLLVLLLIPVVVFGQTPPVSTVGAMPDTVTTLQVEVPFTVQSTLDWGRYGGVQFYYRYSGIGWTYKGQSWSSPFVLNLPIDNMTYELRTRVEDNEHNVEVVSGAEVTFFVCTACTTSTEPEPNPDVEQVTYVWTRPTTGAPVHHYTFQANTTGTWVDIETNVPEETYTYAAEYDIEVIVRVAGVSASGRQGPWSVASEPYTPTLSDPGPPTAPGKPVRIR